MLKKGHKISKALTMAQLLGWSWEGATFKCLSRAHWNVFKGRTKPRMFKKKQYTKKGRTVRRHPQKREIIAPTCLNCYLAGVLRTCQPQLVLQSNNARRKSNTGLILQNIGSHPLITSNGMGRRRWPRTVATLHTEGCPNVPATNPLCSPRNRRGRELWWAAQVPQPEK